MMWKNENREILYEEKKLYALLMVLMDDIASDSMNKKYVYINFFLGGWAYYW